MSARARLMEVLGGFDRLAVAVSGGVDSMTLAWLAHAALGARAAMYHAASAAVPPEATERVRRHAQRAGWTLRVVDAGELADPAYAANPVDRCYFCKTDLYAVIRRHTDWPMASGANLDDLGDFRPGLRAAALHGVRHPLVEAGIDKATVRALAAEEGLDDLAELPASPCLSSRIETGMPVTVGRLTLVLEVERLLRRELPAAATARCRLRASGVVIELDERTLAALADPQALARRIAAEHGLAEPVTFAVYARGSAFLHGS
jgi:uncharacterized protein